MSKTLLAVGTYTKKEDHVDGKGEGVYLYNLNQETGEFNRLSTTSTINPTYLAFSTSGKFLYVVQETGSECGILNLESTDAQFLI